MTSAYHLYCGSIWAVDASKADACAVERELKVLALSTILEEPWWSNLPHDALSSSGDAERQDGGGHVQRTTC
jgi:hypothetical protein